jgi:hypothetical protein
LNSSSNFNQTFAFFWLYVKQNITLLQSAAATLKRNANKFPNGYIIELNNIEWNEVRSQIVTSPLGGGRAYKPKAFTERGLNMLQ